MTSRSITAGAGNATAAPWPNTFIFVGLEMVWLNEACGGRFAIEWSVAIIVALLTTGVAASMLPATVRAGSAGET